MAHRVIDIPIETEEPKEPILQRVFHITAPNLMGKFGLSFSWGKREVFIGIAFAEIEMEKIIKRKKEKPVLYRQGTGRVVDL